jgi:hypothetical protein
MHALEVLEEMGVVEPPDPAVLDRTAMALLAAGAAESAPSEPDVTTNGAVVSLHRDVETLHSGVERRPSGRRRPRRWLARVAVIVLVAGSAVAVSLAGRPGAPGGPSTAAAAVLQHLADVAAAQPAPSVPGPGQFLYVDSENAYTDSTFNQGPNGQGSYTVLVPEHRQIWIGPDGSGRLFETSGQPVFLSAQDHADWVAAGSPAIADGPSDDSFGPGGLSLQNVSNLPTDPSALAAMLTARKIEGGPPGPAEDFVQIGDLLRETDASPQLRSALYEVAAGLPGVVSLGTVVDHAGRSGIGLAYVSHGSQSELIFDPTTSALLGEQDTVVGSGPREPVGTVVGWAAYLKSAVVDSTTSTGQQGPTVPLSPSAQSVTSGQPNQ